MGNFCQQVLKPLGSYKRLFTVLTHFYVVAHSATLKHKFTLPLLHEAQIQSS